ncbi:MULTISPECIES: GNAT family N-acetyltransferase [Furfurilactobacillus]|uniref:GNAT family N-acetyltransferase n=1 Tax=Furfurilactobacillus rossiae TaxID=231049 RepID=A0A7C9N5U2_9LACO|nr:GNAT family N-acetyltransferase [Furfurilactobacillus milii]
MHINDIILVAEREEQIVGYIHAEHCQTLYHGPLLSILALAILPDFQGNHIGQSLMHALEKIAVSIGIEGMRLNSGKQRTNAHLFYKHLNYVNDHDQKRFYKHL